MNYLRKLSPGLILTFFVAGLSILLTHLSVVQKLSLSSTVIAIILGIVIGNTVYKKWSMVCAAGVDFSKQRILRLAIIFFGLRITLQDIVDVGLNAILIDATVLVSTFLLTLYLGQKILGLDKQTSILIGSGSSICGAAAILATSSIIPQNSEAGGKSSNFASKISISIAAIVIFGTLAMFLYPFMYWLLPSSWGVSESAYGIYIGSTIHEVAQVAGAGEAISNDAANSAVISKMIRVLMLAPFLIALSAWFAHQSNAISEKKQPIVIPWFAVAFIGMAVISSTGWIPPAIQNALIWLDNLFLTAAMGALGLTTHHRIFRQAGYKPMLLGALIFIWLIIGGAGINILFNTLLH